MPAALPSLALSVRIASVLTWLGVALIPLDASIARADAASPPIVIVVFDELPTVSILGADARVDAASYPSFAALAATSTWARGASTVSTRALEALPALLTGRFPGPKRRLAIHAEFPENLFSWLEGDYDLNVHEAQSLLRPTKLDPAAQAKWLIDVRRDTHKARPQGRVFRSFVKELDRRARAASGEAPRPTLDFIHVMLPQLPASHSATGARYRPHRMEGNVAEIWEGEAPLIEDAWRRHLNEARFADALLGTLVEALRSAGRFDESLIVVTSLYGAGFWPDESRRTPSRTAHPEDVLLVPLFVKAPGQTRGAVVEDVVQSIDVVPTLVAMLGREKPWAMDGCAMTDPGCERPAGRRALRADGSRESRVADAYPAGLHRRRATLDRKLALFPDAAHLDRSWPAGRFEAWLGRPVDPGAVVALEESAGSWSVGRGARDWHGARAAGGPRFVGVIELGDPAADSPPPWIAIALNGQLEAVARVVPDRRDRSVVRAMLPEAALRRRVNVLELYLVRDDERGPVLVPLEERAPGRRSGKPGKPKQPEKPAPS